ncbi:hypothetical protein SNE40_016384 [Patella caerulea]|uniref:Interferon-induced transmembrane protein n=1 Tax=Patella caerulea TaxID=87958 RepID=A0AAN8PIW5_PATCE
MDKTNGSQLPVSNPVDEQYNPVNEQSKLVDEQSNPVDEQSNLVDRKAKPVVEQPYSVDMASLIINRATNVEEEGVESYSMDPYIKNTKEDKNLESNTILPYLVRKVDSKELLPRPWTSTNQLLIASYISVLCCCFIGVFANRYAWKAKSYNNRSRYHEAKQYARKSVKWMYAAFGCALAITALTLLIYFSN